MAERSKGGRFRKLLGGGGAEEEPLVPEPPMPAPLTFDPNVEYHATVEMVSRATGLDAEGNEAPLPQHGAGSLKVVPCNWVDPKTGNTVALPIIGVDHCMIGPEAAVKALDPNAQQITRTIQIGDHVFAGWNTGHDLAAIIEFAKQPGSQVFPNLIYFFRGYTFHPGTAPTAAPPARPPLLGQTNDEIIVVDTGWVTDDPDKGVHDDPFHPPSPFDLTQGHGPAIARAIEVMVEPARRDAGVELRRIAYFDGFLRKALRFPAPYTANSLIRGFDSMALAVTLSRLIHCHVLNLSLGTVACPDLMAGYDPVRLWIETYGHIQVVAAAGNHRTNAPSWPAAYAGQSMPKHLPNVWSVGSATGAQVHDFSAWGDWVTHWDDGQSVPVAHWFHTDGAVWSGTSFATPKIVARCATRTLTADHTVPRSK